jgi:hypothetical protein
MGEYKMSKRSRRHTIQTINHIVNNLKFQAVRTGKFKSDDPELFYLGKPIGIYQNSIEVYNNRNRLDRKPLPTHAYKSLIQQISTLEYINQAFSKSDFKEIFK